MPDSIEKKLMKRNQKSDIMKIMTIASIKNADLLFMRDSSDFSKEIIKTTSTYSHVGIYFDGMIYHASRKLGVAKQNLEEVL